MGNVGRDVYSFQGYTLDLDPWLRTERPSGNRVKSEKLRASRYFVANAGRLISKDELVNAVWPNVIVSDDSLAQCVSDVRQALNDADRRIIRTVPRRGYLFAAPVAVQPRHRALGRPSRARRSSRSGPSAGSGFALGLAPFNQHVDPTETPAAVTVPAIVAVRCHRPRRGFPCTALQLR